MAQPLLSTAVLQCSFGAAPVPLQVLPTAKVLAGGLPPATVLNDAAMVNVMSFGLCSSLANPTVAAATAAALGVLTPMPCVPVIVTPWQSPDPQVVVGGQPVVTAPAQCQCAWGGMVQATPGPSTVQYG